MNSNVSNQKDVVVIGAGIAGLSAATRLDQAGVDVLVLEAQSRVGGRVQRREINDGQTVELGAQAFNRDMKMLLRSAQQHGLHRAPLHNLGDKRCDQLSATQWDAAIQPLETLLERAANHPEEYRALYQNAATSLADAVDRLSIDASSRQIMDSHVQELWGRSMDRLQFAHAVDVSARFDSDRHDWEYQLIEGFGALAERMADTLEGKLTLDSPVDRLEPSASSVAITSNAGVVHAQAAIVAVPPTVASRFVPDHHWSQSALAAYEDGDLIKIVAHYEDTFWRREGFSGESVSADLAGFATADGTLAGGGTPTLLIFIGGSQAQQLATLSETERTARIYSILVRLFGKKAANPVAWIERIWVDDPWVGGAYNAHVAPSEMLEPDAVLRQLKDRITFAGAEIAERFPGYVEGALCEGRNAADRVLHRLNKHETNPIRLSSRKPGLWARLRSKLLR